MIDSSLAVHVRNFKINREHVQQFFDGWTIQMSVKHHMQDGIARYPDFSDP
jgi:hypothetical protein